MTIPNNLRHEYKSGLAELIKKWANYRKQKTETQLHEFVLSCDELTKNIADYRLQALQQVLDSIVNAAQKEIVTPSNTNNLIKEIDWLINQLIRANQQSTDPFLQEGKVKADVDNFDQPINLHTSRISRGARPNIVIIDDQESVALALASSLKDFALNTSYFLSISDYQHSAQFLETDLVLLDVVMPNVTSKEVFLFAESLIEQGVKVISCSSQFTFDSRLLAVRANVSDYAVKPINTYVLVEKIGRSLGLQQKQNYQIVIVDDQEMMGAFYKSMLEQLGCEVTFYSSASSLFKALDDLNPDMFLLDMMMPEVNGFEVARMLRQEQKFDFAPILFITGDDNIENRLSAIAAGADDVINKSSAIKTITSQVITRLERASKVRAFVAKDPLTGVLNHGQIVESANNAIRSSKRRNITTVMAVIDADSFKEVNDTYGHVAGDKVLCALGQLLANSVRETDIVGRYGGEEFVIVFEDCSMEDAANKVVKIKDIFGEISFIENSQEFNVTFSAGIVELTRFDNVMSAISSADKALYKAKKDGRNRVVKYKFHND